MTELKFPIKIPMEEGWTCEVNYNGSIRMRENHSGRKQTIVSTSFFEHDRAAIIKALEVSQNVRRIWAVNYAKEKVKREMNKDYEK